MSDFLEELSQGLDKIKQSNYHTIYKFISSTEVKNKLEQEIVNEVNSKKLEVILRKFYKLKSDLDNNKITSMTKLRNELQKVIEFLNKKEDNNFPKFEAVEIKNKNSIFIIEAPLLLSTFMSRLTYKRLQEIGLKSVSGYYYFEKIKFIAGDLKVVNKEKISEFVEILNNKIPKEIAIIHNISTTINDKYLALLVYKINSISFEEVVNHMKNYRIYVK